MAASLAAEVQSCLTSFWTPQSLAALNTATLRTLLLLKVCVGKGGAGREAWMCGRLTLGGAEPRCVGLPWVGLSRVKVCRFAPHSEYVFFCHSKFLPTPLFLSLALACAYMWSAGIPPLYASPLQLQPSAHTHPCSYSPQRPPPPYSYSLQQTPHICNSAHSTHPVHSFH